jgi:phosphate:Na+ symporter
VLMLPMLRVLIRFLERAITEPAHDLSQPKYLSEAVDEFPMTIEIALRKEVRHLYENAVELIVHGLNLHRHDIFDAPDIANVVANSNAPFDFDIDERYETRIKTLYSAIVEFATRAGSKKIPQDQMESIYILRDVAARIVRAVKSVKHMRRNVTAFTERPHGVITGVYNDLRTEIARILVEINKLDLANPEERSSLWLDQELVQVEADQQNTSRNIEAMIRNNSISATDATSFMNDSSYAYNAMRDLIGAARAYYIETESAMAEVERILTLEEDEVSDIVSGKKPKPT